MIEFQGICFALPTYTKLTTTYNDHRTSNLPF